MGLAWSVWPVEEGGWTWNIMEMPSLFLRQTNISPSSSWNCRRRRASKRLVVFFLPFVAWKGNFFFAVKVCSCLQWFEKINRDSNDLKWTNIYIVLWDFDAKKSWRNWNKMLVNCPEVLTFSFSMCSEYFFLSIRLFRFAFEFGI